MTSSFECAGARPVTAGSCGCGCARHRSYSVVQSALARGSTGILRIVVCGGTCTVHVHDVATVSVVVGTVISPGVTQLPRNLR